MVTEDKLHTVSVRMIYTPYVDISIPKSFKKTVESMKNLPASKIWEAVLKNNPKNLGRTKNKCSGIRAVAEANGQTIPLAFAFTTSTDGTAAEGAKDHMLQHVLGHIDEKCPNISFKKPPAKHDPRRAFDFIDPTWAPQEAGWQADFRAGCSAFLFSRFRLCKHLVREANAKLDNSKINHSPTSSSFPTSPNLRRNNFPPYYNIPGIHYLADPDSDPEDVDEIEIVVLGQGISRSQPGSSRAQTAAAEPEDESHNDSEHDHDGGRESEVGNASSDNDLDGEISMEEDNGDDRVFNSEAQRIHLKRCFASFMDVVESPGGVHPKIVKFPTALEALLFNTDCQSTMAQLGHSTGAQSAPGALL
ncbi:hypothetical protein B0H13DRAFT_1903005 [Mycena leptocephala]|nr:hypothetical protein B0H13DRAFT_1903005 [Mycena leptocephala]